MQLPLIHKFVAISFIPCLGCMLYLAVLFAALQQAEHQTQQQLNLRDALDDCNEISGGLLRLGVQLSLHIRDQDDDLVDVWRGARKRIDQRLNDLQLRCHRRPEQIKTIFELRQILAEADRMAADNLDFHNRTGKVFASIRVYRELVPQLEHVQSLLRLLGGQLSSDDTNQPLPYSAKLVPLLLWSIPMTAVLSLVMALSLSRGVTGRLSRLAENIDRLAKFEQLVAPPGGSDEIARLEKVFFDMAREVAAAARSEKAAIENTPDIICTLTSDSTIKSINHAQVFGQERNAVIGQPLTQFVFEDDRQDAADFVARVLATSEFSSIELRMPSQERWWLWSATWSAEEQLIFIIVSDITEFKQAELAVRNSEAKFAGIAEVTPAGMLLVERTGAVMHANPAAAKLVQADQAALKTVCLSKLLCAGSRELNEAVLSSMSGKGQQTVDVLTTTPPRKADLSVTEVGIGGRSCFLLTFVDATERCHAQQAQDTLVSMIAHDIATPLTTIQAQLYLATSGALGAFEREMSRRFSDGYETSKRLMRIIGNILRIAKYRPELVTAHLVAAPASQVVSAAVELANRMLKHESVHFETEGPDPVLEVDPDAMAQALATILVATSDSADANDDQITVEIHGAADACTIMINAAAGQFATKSLPLEIAFSRAIVKAHGGTLALEDRGALRINLPCSSHS